MVMSYPYRVPPILPDATRGDDTYAQSPNERFIAYESTLNDRTEIWAHPYPDGAPTWTPS
jgi:hypothetical protein